MERAFLLAGQSPSIKEWCSGVVMSGFARLRRARDTHEQFTHLGEDSLATSQTEKPWVNIAIRLIPLLAALGLVFGFAALWVWPPQTDSPADFVQKHASYAQCVVANVKEVGGKEKILASHDMDIDGRESLQQKLSEAKNSFDKVCNSLVPSASKPPAGRNRQDLWIRRVEGWPVYGSSRYASCLALSS